MATRFRSPENLSARGYSNVVHNGLSLYEIVYLDELEKQTYELLSLHPSTTPSQYESLILANKV